MSLALVLSLLSLAVSAFTIWMQYQMRKGKPFPRWLP